VPSRGEFLEAEMAEAVGAEKRVEGRSSYRDRYYTRSLVTSLGKLELRVPQDRNVCFLPRCSALPVQREGVGGRAHPEVHPGGVDPEGAISEEFCGYSFIEGAISEINKKLDAELGRYTRRELEPSMPYLIRASGSGGKMANRESAIFAVKRRSSGLKRVISVVLQKVVRRLPDYVHFLRNALDYLPRKVADDCSVEPRRLYVGAMLRKLAGISLLAAARVFNDKLLEKDI
jgi:putative transposase